MKNNTRKILLALVLVLSIIMSFATVSAFAAEGNTVYLNPGEDWAAADARFAIYTWDGGDQWFDMTDSDGDGVYECVLPDGIVNIIFCRMNPAFTENRWNSADEEGSENKPVWNQTKDLILHVDGTFKITDPWAGEGKAADGTWEGGTAVEGGNTGDSGNTGGAPAGDFESLTVAGVAGLCYTEWNVNDTYNDMTYNEETGLYEKTFTGIPAGTYECKVAANHSWDLAWGGDAGEFGNYSFTTFEEHDITITFDPTTSTVAHTVSDSTGADEDRPLPEAPDIDETDTITVYLSNSANWGTPYAHVWIEGPTDTPLATWPGVEMLWDADKLIYYVEIPAAYDSVVFSNKDDGTQTGDLVIPGDGAMFDNGTNEWGDIKDYTPPTPPSNTTEDVTVYVKDDAGWGDVYIYYWDADGAEAFSFPGTPMDYNSETGFYEAVIPAGYWAVLFSNGGSWEDGSLQQTPDLIIPTNGKVYLSNSHENLYNDGSADDNGAWYGVGEEQPGGDQPGGDQPSDDKPAPEMTWLQKLAKALLLFLRSIEDFFKGMFKK